MRASDWPTTHAIAVSGRYTRDLLVNMRLVIPARARIARATGMFRLNDAREAPQLLADVRMGARMRGGKGTCAQRRILDGILETRAWC